MLKSNLDKIRLDITFLKVKQILNLFFLLYIVTKQTYWINLIITVKSRCCYLQRLLIPKKITLARLAFSGGTVASWLVCPTLVRAVQVRALAGVIVLCSWARHFTLTVPLSTQVYKWVPANLMLGGDPAMD